MTRWLTSALLLGCFGLHSAAQAQSVEVEGSAGAKRPVTVADGIEITAAGDRSLATLALSSNVVQFSADGSEFAFLTQRGNLENDTVDYSLLIFHAKDVFDSPHADIITTFASSSNREAIRRVRWLPNNETIMFLGEHPGETPQLYEVNIRTKKLERLTHQPEVIADYSMSESGNSLVYVAKASSLTVASNDMRRQGFFVTSQRWVELYTNQRPSDTRHEIYVKTAGMETPKHAGSSVDLNADTMGLSVSPNGRYALLRAYVTSPPAVWDEYQYKAEGDTASSAACDADHPSQCPERLLVVDLERGTVEPLLNTPIVAKRPAGRLLAAWTRENSVFVVNTLLPLDSIGGEERARRLTHVYAAEVTVPGRRVMTISERLEPYPGFFLESDAATDRIVVKTGVATLGRPIEFRRDGNHWTVREVHEGSQEQRSNRLSVTLDQDMNSPPKLVVSDPKTNRKAVVMDLNPQFSQLTFGRVEIFPWKTRDGHFGEGTLYYPPDYAPGNKYPLIIQTHDERRDRFWIYGPYTTAYAAQALANRGFIVLQMGQVDIYEKAAVDELYSYYGTAQEGLHYTTLFESAIDALDQRGLIDRNRVGLSGFSRTVYHVLYALTHSRYHFAASVVADGVNFGPLNCLSHYVPYHLCEKMNGSGPPYGKDLALWAKESPTLRLDQIDAPLLLQAISEPLGEWEIFAGLRWLRKPVEMLNFYPEGEHILVRPRQRLLSQGTVVDWYCFWLKGEEDPDPAKAEQYKRWRELRKLQGASVKPDASSR